MPNVVAVLFARNEEHNLPHTLRILNGFKRNHLLRHIVVIDDASTDNTARIAREAGAVVITNPKNIGKRKGFIPGAFKAKELGADVLVTLDADIQHFPQRTLRKMINQVVSGGYQMAIAQQFEHHTDESAKYDINNPPKKVKVGMLDWGNHEWGLGRPIAFLKTSNSKIFYNPVENPGSNAHRAIRMSALNPLFNGSKKWHDYLTRSDKIPKTLMLKSCGIIVPNRSKGIPKRTIRKSKLWGLETVLDTLIPAKRIITLSGPSTLLGAEQLAKTSPVFTGSAYRDKFWINFNAQEISKGRVKHLQKLRSDRAKHLLEKRAKRLGLQKPIIRRV